ncbi:LOW QUALITY PROTEIN: probable glutathione peroxidase 8 [Gymnogyps californianus]|uniref:LOW QUALITY PROTEIN: probable glutathione peroxidase 8 n=1 Tax=Gymnogyps californianus TaxID=33616 RepID=UPI0021C5F392|nr:LOW QUALITY PROTEIN: probable glutathione peroxidase 8 [Gymnogyps californianus]
MEPLTTTYPLKYSVPKARVFVVFLLMVLCTAILCLLQLRFFKPKIKDFYSFEVKDSQGRIVSLEKYRGKVTLVVNVASYCQHTDKNYITLQELHREFGPSHFTVLAFPCNQFRPSEPSSSQEIESFAKRNDGVTFSVFQKIKILGSKAEPAFKFLIVDSTTMLRLSDLVGGGRSSIWGYSVQPTSSGPVLGPGVRTQHNEMAKKEAE